MQRQTLFLLAVLAALFFLLINRFRRAPAPAPAPSPAPAPPVPCVPAPPDRKSFNITGTPTLVTTVGDLQTALANGDTVIDIIFPLTLDSPPYTITSTTRITSSNGSVLSYSGQDYIFVIDGADIQVEFDNLTILWTDTISEQSDSFIYLAISSSDVSLSIHDCSVFYPNTFLQTDSFCKEAYIYENSFSSSTDATSSTCLFFNLNPSVAIIENNSFTPSQQQDNQNHQLVVLANNTSTPQDVVQFVVRNNKTITPPSPATNVQFFTTGNSQSTTVNARVYCYGNEISGISTYFVLVRGALYSDKFDFIYIADNTATWNGNQTQPFLSFDDSIPASDTVGQTIIYAKNNSLTRQSLSIPSIWEPVASTNGTNVPVSVAGFNSNALQPLDPLLPLIERGLCQ